MEYKDLKKVTMKGAGLTWATLRSNGFVLVGCILLVLVNQPPANSLLYTWCLMASSCWMKSETTWASCRNISWHACNISACIHATQGAAGGIRAHDLLGTCLFFRAVWPGDQGHPLFGAACGPGAPHKSPYLVRRGGARRTRKGHAQSIWGHIGCRQEF